jgi:hypothetical protein
LLTQSYDSGVGNTTINALNGIDTDSFGYASIFAANADWGFYSLFEDPNYGHAGVRGVSIAKNAYIDAATLSLKFAAVGAAWPGGKLYAKKVDQGAIVVNSDSARQWQAGGKLTTAYIQIPSYATLTAGTYVYDVKAILLELMSHDSWDETDGLVQFACFPDAACTDDTYSLTVDKYEGSGATATSNFLLEVDYYVSAGNPETAAIRSGYVINYMPVSAADLAIADRLRFVVQDNAGGRESQNIDAGDAAAFTATVRDGTAKTVAVTGSFAELGTWSAPTPQERLFGRAFNGDSELSAGAILSSLGYADGWKFLPAIYDYLWVTTCKFSATDVLRSYWDLWNYTTYGTTNQSAMFLTADGTANTVTLDLQTGTRVQSTETGITAGAGRTLRTMVFWDHAAKTWNWKLVVEDSTGAVLITRTGSGAVASVWDHTSMTAQNIDRRWLTGFRLDGGAGMHGHALIEWRSSAAGIWESTGDWMTKSWVRGIKSLDPRLMA